MCIGSVTSIAQSKRLGRHTVRHSAKTAAFVFMKLQEVFLTELRDRAARRPQPCFDLLFDRIEFDETHQTLSVKVSDFSAVIEMERLLHHPLAGLSNCRPTRNAVCSIDPLANCEYWFSECWMPLGCGCGAGILSANSQVVE